jgi:dUTP pyrophosphatase
MSSHDIITISSLNNNTITSNPDLLSGTFQMYPIKYRYNNDAIVQEIILLNEDATVPVKGTKYSACFDLFSPIECIIEPGANKLIKTGISISWNNPLYYLQILSRSGLCYKNNINTQAGVIDFDYLKEIGVILQNNSNIPFKVEKGMRIAQYTFLKIPEVLTSVVKEFTIELDSDRIGGFGSTGI